jgi:hypothetical protein
MTTDDELEAAARAATEAYPGEWEARPWDWVLRDGVRSRGNVLVAERDEAVLAEMRLGGIPADEWVQRSAAVFAYFALADPQTVLALLARVRAAEAERVAELEGDPITPEKLTAAGFGGWVAFEGTCPTYSNGRFAVIKQDAGWVAVRFVGKGKRPRDLGPVASMADVRRVTTELEGARPPADSATESGSSSRPVSGPESPQRDGG